MDRERLSQASGCEKCRYQRQGYLLHKVPSDGSHVRAVKKMLPRSASTSGCAHRLSVAPVCVFSLCVCVFVCVVRTLPPVHERTGPSVSLAFSHWEQLRLGCAAASLTFAILSPFLPQCLCVFHRNIRCLLRTIYIDI